MLSFLILSLFSVSILNCLLLLNVLVNSVRIPNDKKLKKKLQDKCTKYKIYEVSIQDHILEIIEQNEFYTVTLFYITY